MEWASKEATKGASPPSGSTLTPEVPTGEDKVDRDEPVEPGAGAGDNDGPEPGFEFTPEESDKEEKPTGKERREQLEQALGEFTTKWANAMKEQLENPESDVNMPDFPPPGEPPISYNDAVEFFAEKHKKPAEEIEQTQTAFYKPENKGKLIKQIKEIVGKVDPTDPDKERGEKMKAVAGKNAKQVMTDFIEAINRGGDFAKSVVGGGEYEWRLRIGLPEDKEIPTVAELNKIATGEDLNTALEKKHAGEGTKYLGLSNVAGYIKNGYVVAGTNDMTNKMREALGERSVGQENFDSGYLSVYLAMNGVSNPGTGGGQNYWTVPDGMKKDNVPNASVDACYGVNFNGNIEGGLVISTGELFSAVLMYKAVESVDDDSEIFIETREARTDDEGTAETEASEEEERKIDVIHDWLYDENNLNDDQYYQYTNKLKGLSLMDYQYNNDSGSMEWNYNNRYQKFMLKYVREYPDASGEDYYEWFKETYKLPSIPEPVPEASATPSPPPSPDLTEKTFDWLPQEVESTPDKSTHATEEEHTDDESAKAADKLAEELDSLGF
jgi:hypothetical protein